jgi:sulfopropanediol 3-dehydrogenase
MKIFKRGGHRLFERDPKTVQIVSEMLLDLERNGMDAVRRYSEKFDNWNPDRFELSEKQIEEAIRQVPPQIIADTLYSQENVRRFAKTQMEMFKDVEIEVRRGAVLGHKNIPVNSVCSYIPGGTYPLFGSAQMSIIPPKVAGVKNVCAFTPPTKEGSFYPATINAMKKAGADRIFVVGGVPAIAMAAFGMEGLEPADMICGAGNKYITEAKRQLFGRCGIDLLAGPSEIVIIADDSVDPATVACDLLSQAEHDVNSCLALICFDDSFAQKCMDELEKQLQTLETRDIAEKSWANYGTVYIAESIDEAIAISDDWAPEHLEVLTRTADQQYYLDHLKNYGSLFIGEETTVAFGDKTIGTNHILPTSRAARYTGGVWVGKFIRTLTYQRCTKSASVEVGEVVYRQCVAEKLPGHAAAAKLRVDKYQVNGKRY